MRFEKAVKKATKKMLRRDHAYILNGVTHVPEVVRASGGRDYIWVEEAERYKRSVIIPHTPSQMKAIGAQLMRHAYIDIVDRIAMRYYLDIAELMDR